MTWIVHLCAEHGFPVDVPETCDCIDRTGSRTVEEVEVVRATEYENAVEAEREWCNQILDVDQRDQGDGRLLATLANMAATRLRELGRP